MPVNGGRGHLAATWELLKPYSSFERLKGDPVKAEMQQRTDAHRVAPLVMVVDDEVLIRLIAVDMLHDAGFRVVEACSADEAVTLLATDIECDLIFTDVNMPGAMDGLGLAAFVKETYPLVPVVLTSGGVPADLLSQAEPAAVVPKPYSLIDLARTIGEVLGARRD